MGRVEPRVTKRAVEPASDKEGADLALINLAIGEAAELDAVRTAAQRGRPSALSTGAMRSRDASIFAPP